MTPAAPSTAPDPPSGQVWAHVGQSFKPRDYDVVVLGAGRMGSAFAFYLRHLAPHLSLLLLEEGGLPNEDGATLLAPGLWTARDVPPARLDEARWTRQQLATAFGDISFQPRPLIELFAEEGTDRINAAEALAPFPDALAMVDVSALPFAQVDTQAATYRPGAVALAAAQSAVRLGADLMLNARAHAVLAPDGTGGTVVTQRLSVTNTHQIIVHETHRLRAGVIVLALGADGPHAAEHELGIHTTHARAYRQTPRLDVPSSDGTPTLRAAGLTLRPQNGGFTLIPAIHHRDPHGYTPTGGHLTGVPTGLRRETLEDLVALMDALPPLGTEALGLGRSLSDIPGAWLALPRGRADGGAGGLPLHQQLTGGVHLLLGGPHADTLGLAVAHDLAAAVAGITGRPWENEGAGT
ncbi:FAD-dependent oxidoreductase [Deinococcus arenicola]|uniref:FAD-dependent oxidoreductase n=1 Tax=Deinococcus arenicola TaxID=2994950 RepID=A0ABU4DTE4_9DEIO|nr:FAD-dependent oxidoreductase [Deinococcus sp. ZS9-10]MDV6375643.1 FAD-dependent oxidoreductase [Deinococcus sp. ZS9-10]